MPQAATSTQLPEKWYVIAVTDPNIAAWYQQLKADYPNEPENIIDHMMRSIIDYGDGSGPGYDYRTAIEKGLRPSVQPDGKYHWGGDVEDVIVKGEQHPTRHLTDQARTRTRVQQRIDENVGRVEKVQKKAQEQQQVVDSYVDLVKAYPESYSQIKSLIKEGVHDLETITKIVRGSAIGKRKEEPSKLDFFDKLAEFRHFKTWTDLVPFVSGAADIAEMTELLSAANALENETATPEQVELLQQYVDYSDADRTWGFKVLDLVSNLPAFAGEIYFTGGLYTAGKKATLETGKAVLGNLITKQGKKKLADYTAKGAGQIAKKSVAAVGGASLQAVPAGITRIPAETLERMLPILQLDDEEKLVVAEEGQSAMDALVDATKGQWIEMVSERSGGLFKALGKPVKEAIARTSIMKRWMKTNPGATVSQFREVLNRAGYHGVVNEILEERVAALARATPGIGTGEEFEDPTSKEFWEQLSVEAAAFSVPGAMGVGADIQARRKEKKAEEASIEATAVSRLSPEGVAGVDEQGRKVTLGRPAQLRVGKRETEKDALSEVDAALKAGETDEGTANIAKFLISQDPDYDARSSLAISGEVMEITDDYIINVLGKTPEKFFKEEGITREEGAEYTSPGYTKVDIQEGIAKTGIRLFKGHDADTVVEEWYHDWWFHTDEKTRKDFEKYHDKSGDTRSVEEHFAQEGRDYFFSKGMHKKAGPLEAIFERAKETLVALIARIEKLNGAKIPKKIKDIYKAAGVRELKPLTKKQSADLKKRKMQFQLRAKPKSKEFKSWFGDSKVVDEKGQPMVVYHGTTVTENFSEFKTGEVSKKTFEKRYGIFFSENPDYASGWASDAFGNPEEHGKVYPAYMSLQNPIDLSDTGDVFEFEDALVAFDQEHGYDLYDDWINLPLNMKWKVFDNPFGEKFVGVLKSLGYDGALLYETAGKTGKPVGTTYVAFKPEQIKSQFNEKPTKEDPRIMHQVRKFTDRENFEMQDTAKKIFGVTEDPREAGYILNDGSMLDFSGKIEGGTPGVRAHDHRNINRVGDVEEGGLDKFDDIGMREFVQSGAIRYMPESFTFHLGSQHPDQGQLSTMRKLIEDPPGMDYPSENLFLYDTPITIRIDKSGFNEKGDPFDSNLNIFEKNYDRDTSWEVIKRDILQYIKTGREPSIVQQFHQVKKKTAALKLKEKPRSKEFKSWFGDSKVVDEKGQPAVAYHGTIKDIEAFDKEPMNWFTLDPKIANFYARDHRGREKVPGTERGGQVYPVYLNIKNPLTIGEELDLGDNTSMDEFIFAIEEIIGDKLSPAEEADIIDDARNAAYDRIQISKASFGMEEDSEAAEEALEEQNMYSFIDGNYALKRALQDRGYDGMVATEAFYSPFRGIGKKVDHNVYIAFEPNQIKSQFNPKPTKGPKIMFQTRKNPKIVKEGRKLFTSWDPLTDKQVSKSKAMQVYQKLQKSAELGNHPFDRGYVLVGNLGMLDLTDEKGDVVLGAIASFDKGTGKGTQLLQMTLKAADDVGVKLTGIVRQIGIQGLNDDQLLEWYRRQGFETKEEGDIQHITYTPPSLKKVTLSGKFQETEEDPKIMHQTRKKKKKPDFPRIKKTGKYIALPDGINTPQKLSGLVTKLVNMSKEGSEGRYWYERSSDVILTAVNGDQKEAQKVAGLVGLFSQGTGLVPNWRGALRYYLNSKAGKPSVEGRFPASMVPKAEKIMKGVIPLGIKTNNFYTNLMRHIDPGMKQGVTVDLWMMRALGYKTDSPTEAQYDRASKLISLAAERLGWEAPQVQSAVWTTIKSKWEFVEKDIKNEAISKGHFIQAKKVDGKVVPGHWKNEPSRILYRNKFLKAAFKVPSSKVKAIDFADLMGAELATITMETVPGVNDYFTKVNTERDYVQLNDMQVALSRLIIDEKGNDRLAQAAGLLVMGDMSAPGAFLEKVSPGKQLTIVAPKGKDDLDISEPVEEQIQEYAALFGSLFHQWGVGYHKPMVETTIKKSNLAEVRFENEVRLTPEESKKFTMAMAEEIETKYGEEHIYDVYLAPASTGYRWINLTNEKAELIASRMPEGETSEYKEINNKDFHDLVDDVTKKTFPNYKYEMALYRGLSSLIYDSEKDAKDNNGKNYKEILSGSPRSSIYRGLLSDLAPQVNQVYQDYARENNWGKAPTKDQKIVFAVRHKRLLPKEKTPKQQALPGSKSPDLELDPERLRDTFQRMIQDKMNRLGHVMGKVKEIRPVSDEEDAYLAAEMYIGKAREKMDKFEDEVYGKEGSLLDRIIKAGYTLEDFGKYLHARHAKERNDHIANIRDDMPDGGSGMTNKEAARILKKHKGDKQIEAFAKEFYRRVTKRALRARLNADLIDRETYDYLTNYYKNYVPLFVIKDVENRTTPTGKGLSVPQGAELKRAKGSEKERANPVFSAIHEMMGVIRRTEKNKVGLKFLDIAEEFDSEAWSVKRQRYKPVYNKNGELEFMDPLFDLGDNVFAVRREGKLHLITINDKALARGLKNLGTEKANKYLMKANNYLRAIVTTWNPEFLITNFARDIQTALIHVAGEHKGVAATVLKNTPKAMRGVWKNVRGKEANYWAEMYDELKKAGGKVGWFDMDTLEEHQAKVEKELQKVQDGKGNARAAARALADFIESANEAVESGVRLATFEALRKKGMSAERAAQVAKNITVNFNKKGELGTTMNSLYLFFNATIQGSARIGLSAARSKKTRAIMGGIVGMSASLGLVNFLIAPDEWEKKAEWEKDNYLIFMMPDGDDIRIRVPYGYNIFHVMGQTAADLIQGGVVEEHGIENLDYGAAMSRILGAASDAFSPFGDGSWIQAATPTLGDPIVQLLENKKFHGGPIRPEIPSYAKNKADYKNYWSSNPPSWVSRAVTEGLSMITGGEKFEGIKKDRDGNPQDHYMPGWWDINPTTLDHLFGFMTGGLGKFVSRSIDTGINFAVGRPTASKDIPFIRQFYGQPDKRAIKEKGLIREYVKNSEIKNYNHVEVARFKRYVFDAIKLGQLTESQSKLVKDENGNMVPKVIRDFMNSQRLTQGLAPIDYSSRKYRTRSRTRSKKR